MSEFESGDVVRLRQEFAFWPAGTRGVVVEMREALLNGHDCAVHLDGREGPSCFYDRELVREPASVQPDRSPE